MSFDGLFTHAMVGELAELLVGGRVAKITQPYANEVILGIRAQRKNWPLLLSAHPELARVQITQIPYTNPPVPTNFTMTLRKYLSGATLRALTQVGSDRIVQLDFTARNELGDDLSLRLIVEIMARHSNLFLVDLATGKILDLIHHVSPDQNRVRTLLPGAMYVAPPAQDKRDPFAESAKAAVSGLLADLADGEADAANAGTGNGPRSLPQRLQQRYQGFARDSAVELAARLTAAGLPTMEVAEADGRFSQTPAEMTTVEAAWSGFFAGFDAPEPIITTTERSVAFAAFPYTTLEGPNTAYPTLSEMLDAFYAQKAESERVRNQGATLIRALKNLIAKDEKKQKKLADTLAASERADDFRIRGEILTTYLNEVPRGETSVTLPNFYADMAPLTIPLSNQLGPSQNAQKYFAKYQKLRNAVAYVNEQMTANQAELDYLTGVLAQIELASPKDLVDIRAELEAGGYIRAKKVGKKPQRHKVAAPEEFYASDGTRIWVGKNNLQNDQLTLHKAKKSDIWLHAKDIPGSHVIIDAAKPSDRTLREAAQLAAYFSKNRNGANVPVDWIEVKKIRKPNGAKPGFVVYEGQRTIAVTPEAATVAKLRNPPTL